MVKYQCAMDYKGRRVQPDWDDLPEYVEAEGPSQAAQQFSEQFHMSLGHQYEAEGIWVRAPNGEVFLFAVAFEMKPTTTVRWVRDARWS